MGADLGGTKTPVADAMGRVWGSNGLLLVTLGTLISIGGLNIASSFNTPRCAQALAEGRLLPKFMMKIINIMCLIFRCLLQEDWPFY